MIYKFIIFQKDLAIWAHARMVEHAFALVIKLYVAAREISLAIFVKKVMYPAKESANFVSKVSIVIMWEKKIRKKKVIEFCYHIFKNNNNILSLTWEWHLLFIWIHRILKNKNINLWRRLPILRSGLKILRVLWSLCLSAPIFK